MAGSVWAGPAAGKFTGDEPGCEAAAAAAGAGEAGGCAAAGVVALHEAESVWVLEVSALMPMSSACVEPEPATVGDPTVLPLIVPVTDPVPPVSSTPMPPAVSPVMVLPSIVIAVWAVPSGLITTPPPRTPEAVLVSVLFENVTLFVPAAAELVENWKWSPMLLVNVEPVMLTVAFVVPLASTWIPSLVWSLLNVDDMDGKCRPISLLSAPAAAVPIEWQPCQLSVHWNR